MCAASARVAAPRPPCGGPRAAPLRRLQASDWPQTELDGACLRATGQQELPWYTDVTAEYSGLLKGVTALRVQKVRSLTGLPR